VLEYIMLQLSAVFWDYMWRDYVWMYMVQLVFEFLSSIFEQLCYSLLLEIEPWTLPLCRLWCEADIKLI
jgi:hypothetical protein